MQNIDLGALNSILASSVAMKYVSALLVLLIGYILAKFLASMFTKIMTKFNYLERFFQITDVNLSAKKVIHIASIIIFYIVLLVVFIAVLEILGLDSIKDSLQGLQAKYVPGLLAGLSAFVLAWVIATLAKMGISRAFKSAHIDEKISKEVSDVNSSESIAVSDTLANAVYWFIFLYFLPSILEPLGFKELLNPIYDINSTLVGYLPKILAAGMIFIIGLFIAKIVRKIAVNLLSAVGADALGKKIGIDGLGISKIAGSLVYIIILFPVIVQSLSALEINAISDPAINMLNTILNALPNLLFAIIIVCVSYVVAKLVSGIVIELLSNLGFNSILKKLGIKLKTTTKPANIVGGLVLTFIMLFAGIEAANTLGLSIVGEIAKQFVEFSGQILVGVIVLGIGCYIANIVGDLVKSGTKSKLLPKVAKGAVLTLTVAMGLKEMGIADDIINLAFGLTLGAIAVASALAFGLGSKDIAAKHLESWLKNVK